MVSDEIVPTDVASYELTTLIAGVESLAVIHGSNMYDGVLAPVRFSLRLPRCTH